MAVMTKLRLLLLLIILLPQLSMLPMRKAPPGMQKVQGLRNTFLDKVEMTNARWRHYLRQLRKEHGDSSAQLQEALPDLALWNLAYGEDFLDSTARPHHPLVGVTYQQAVNYCQWRSTYISGREHREVEFSLPSMMVYKLAFDDGNDNKIAEGLYSTGLGFRSFLGLCDNAAEMTAAEGSAIYGYSENGCLETFNYGAPSHALGFRCMAIVQ